MFYVKLGERQENTTEKTPNKSLEKIVAGFKKYIYIFGQVLKSICPKNKKFDKYIYSF